ncbi:DUF6444 domain-containing protein [Acrocarpospora corrugata]|uniref:DUF6444 domain-containing protein n=1 Tax=Acrocarpospora corrugata TaxID=35763 RepID=UPI001478D602
MAARLDALETENAQLKAENAALREENAELRRQLGRTSRNSSQPPSADGLAKPPPRSMRGKSGRRPGKQPGTQGNALMQVADPTRRIPHLPAACDGCGGDLSGATRAGEPVIRQVFDVPEVVVEVTAHELHALACGTITRAQAPADPAAGADGWARALVNLLGDGYRWVAAWQEKGHDRLPDFKRDDLSRRLDDLVERALAAHPPRGAGKQSPARNLALRLRQRKDEVLRFATDFNVAYSNNIAERAIRMIKTKTKVSGGFRTLKGAQVFLAIRGYISTVRKNGQNAARALHDALLGNPWTPALMA